MEDGQGARRARGEAAKRPGGKPPGGARRPGAKAVRVQLHLGEKTVERLGVHCSLVHRDKSAMADEILRKWLGQYGRGRELFPPEPEVPAGQEDPPP